MIKVKKKAVYDAIQFTSEAHQQIKQIMQDQGYFVSDDSNTITLSILTDSGSVDKILRHGDWIVKFDDNKFTPIGNEPFNKNFEPV